MDKSADERRVEEPPTGGVAHFGELEWDRLLRFVELLEDEGQLRGLIGPREMGRLWSRHLLNSTAISEFVDPDVQLADVGSGAGFPGLVTAIIRRDLDVHLIDSMERRTDWLSYCVDELELTNVTVVRSRAEDLGTMNADVVTARAVAALKKLVPWTLPLVKPGGSLIALKGARAEEEIDEAAQVLRKYKVDWADVYDVDVWGSKEGARVVELRKLSS